MKYIFFFIYHFLLVATQTEIINLNLLQFGSNYGLPLIVDEVEYHLIISTRFSSITLVNRNQSYVPSFTISDLKLPCIQVRADSSYIAYYDSLSPRCTIEEALNIEQVSFDYSNFISIPLRNITFYWAKGILNNHQNRYNWTESSGMIGVNYCDTDYCQQTIFGQMLDELYNTSPLLTSQSVFPQRLFGLDFNPEPQNSTMQIGGPSPEYSSSLVWTAAQARFRPANHSFFMYHPSVCSVSLLTNWSTQWLVVVDTASVCLSLPAELYDSVMSWVDLGGDPSSLPLLSFSLYDDIYRTFTGRSANTTQLHILLSDLVLPCSSRVPASTFPSVGSPELNLCLCIIRGSEVQKAQEERWGIPSIVMGSRVLHSLYFMADMGFNSNTTGRIGLAQKRSPEEMRGVWEAANQSCRAKKECRGRDTLDEGHNVCRHSICRNYYLVMVNNQGDCVFDEGSVGFGIALLVLCAMFELFSFLIIQHSHRQLSHRGQQNKTDLFTRTLESWVVAGVDILLLYVLCWKVSNRRRRRQHRRAHDERDGDEDD